MTETSPQPPRPRRQRIEDTLAMLDRHVDCWVATSDPESGAPQLVPLSFVWDGETVLLSTSASSPTGRALVATGAVRLAFGATRDVVMVDGDVEVIDAAELSPDEADRFAGRTGFDPRSLRTRYLYFRVRPTRIQAWREENELAARDLMRDRVWLDD
ncbi:MAG TPA: pyridoxamine 5'-phosphate oxidase family protein [Intrasporangium sp.]|nr:pyridoxamine 5'-phosphate oxidase family protein [Intrasporangium sp.]